MPKERKIYTPKDPTPLARAVVVWLWIYLAAQVLVGAATVLELQAYAAMPGDSSSDNASTGIELVVGGANLIQALVYLVSGFLTLKWIYRASRNAHTLARGLMISPPWAVGWYFVPFAYLWKPFQAVREIWQVSKNPTHWRLVSVPGVLRLWWTLWLVSNAMANVSFRLTMMEHTVSMQTAADYLDLGEAVLDAILAIVVVSIVTQITKMQVTSLAAAEFGPEEKQLAAAPA
jgi:hypothetical protein